MKTTAARPIEVLFLTTTIRRARPMSVTCTKPMSHLDGGVIDLSLRRPSMPGGQVCTKLSFDTHHGAPEERDISDSDCSILKCVICCFWLLFLSVVVCGSPELEPDHAHGSITSGFLLTRHSCKYCNATCFFPAEYDQL